MASIPVKATTGGFPSLSDATLSQTAEDQAVLKDIRKTWQKHYMYWPNNVRSTIIDNLKHVHATKSNRKQPSSHMIWKNGHWNLGHWIIMVAIYGAEKLDGMKKILEKNYPDINFDEMGVIETDSDDSTEDDASTDPAASTTAGATVHTPEKPKKRAAVPGHQGQRSSHRQKTTHAANPQVVNPQAINPQPVNPQATNPQVVNPQVINPQASFDDGGFPEYADHMDYVQHSVEGPAHREQDPFVDTAEEHLRQARFNRQMDEKGGHDGQRSTPHGQRGERFNYQQPKSVTPLQPMQFNDNHSRYPSANAHHERKPSQSRQYNEHPPRNPSVESYREGGPGAFSTAQRFILPAPPTAAHTQSTIHTRQVAQSVSSSPSPYSEPFKFESWESATEPSKQRWEGSPAPSSKPPTVEPSMPAAHFHSRSSLQESPSSRFSSPLAQGPLVPGSDLRSRSSQGRSSAAIEGSVGSPINNNGRSRRGHIRSSEGDPMAIVRLQRDFDEKIYALEQRYADQMRSLRAECSREILEVKFELQNRIASLEERLVHCEAVMGVYDE
ncbi:hypothetical protein MRS44_008053 [Fusarium solani]|uniref:uncharacterized protein n=1 Tax=Fusarium solani TaxID=169388 RepID=UPI0032C4052D|nr:hypothetical protein MRS44_008053 [Fusarium solani]